MKRLISLLLTWILLVTAVAVPVYAQETVFHAGDELYLKIENPTNWASTEGTVMYANFTDASRSENGDRSVVIASADKTRYAPVTGAVYDSVRELYKYTVTDADAGASAMRFWRGNTEKLWNESVVITAADYADGKNTAVVTDWSNTGYLTSTYDYSLTATLRLSAESGEVGDSFDISVVCGDVPDASIACEIFINDEKVADSDAFTFVPESTGAYRVKAAVTAKNASGRIVATDTETALITVGAKAPMTAFEPNCLYVHAIPNDSPDTEAWVKWYPVGNTYYFFLPSSAGNFRSIEMFSTLYADAKMDNGVTLPSYAKQTFPTEFGKSFRMTVGDEDTYRNITFLFSSAEAALWVNNTEDFEGYSDFFDYLKADKENSVEASGAISTPDGVLENVDIKKMKGRGNTSWNADKKGFNITFRNTVSLAGMEKCKKFSLVSNFQDAAMARNRILFDLADAVGVPYSSDSRFIDLYTNGVYQGTYQICQKIDVGSNTLISDFAEDDYLDPDTGGVKSDFCFVTEIDTSPAADDFHFTAVNGNSLTMKAPELAADDPNYAAVRNYVRGKYRTMYNRLQYDNIGDYLDIASMAKVYIINELGKNWDTGASSFYFTYKPDKNGVYKFFASPVWDYDNSLGNANGVRGDLSRLGITDYTLPSGWFASKKGGYAGPNVLAESVKNPLIMAEVRRAWFEDFLPALDTLTSEGISTGELYSADVYADILRDSAAMNYKIWELVTNTSWIADHSSLRKYTAEYTKNNYGQITGVQLSQDSAATGYDQYTFDGQFDYMMNWMTSRAAWMSAQYIADYVPSEIPSEPPTEAPTEAPTEPVEDVIVPDMDGAIAAWVFDATDKAAGDKLKEYGSADDGYVATFGAGRMTLTVSGEKSRALEWSDPEYGKSGTQIVPIMAAGSKNPWGTPYIRLEIPSKGYDELKLTAYFAASNKAPASWKLQYSMDGESFSDIDGAVFTISADSRKTLTAYFDKSALPGFGYYAGSDSILLQLVPVDMTTVDGGDALTTTTSGELALNYVVVQGAEVQREEVLTADADDNGEVDIIDVTCIQRYLAGMQPFTSRQLKAADVDRNGDQESIDATLIQRALAGLKTNSLLTL